MSTEGPSFQGQVRRTMVDSLGPEAALRSEGLLVSLTATVTATTATASALRLP